MNLFTPTLWVSRYQHEGSSEIPPDQLADTLKATRRELIGLIGEPVILEIEGSNYAQSADNVLRDEAIFYAHGLLTLAALLPTINRIRNGAIPQSEKDGDGERAQQFEVYERSTRARVADLRQMAMNALEPYLSRVTEERQTIVSTLKWW